MTRPTAPPDRLSPRQRLAAIALAVIVLAAFVAANAHLIVVSFASQPVCVAQGGAALRAAKPSC
jgi:hypothetical protein